MTSTTIEAKAASPNKPCTWFGFVPSGVATPSPSKPPELKHSQSEEALRLKEENAKLQHVVELLRAKLGVVAKEGDKAAKDAALHVFPINPEQDLAFSGAEGKEGLKDFYNVLSASLKVPAAAAKKEAKKGGGVAMETVGAAATRGGEVKTAVMVGGEAEKLKAQLPRVEGALPTAPVAPPSTAPAADTHAGIKTLDSASTEALIVTARPETEDDEPAEQQVAVLDLQNVEWWTLVEKEPEPKEDEDEYQDVQHDSSSVPVNTSTDVPDDGSNPQLLGGDYELIKDEELATALADYVAASMARFPEAKRISAEEMKSLLETTFGPGREPGTLAKLWGWGNFAYSVYGWGTWAFQLYKEPAMIRIVATGVYKAATWMLVFIL